MRNTPADITRQYADYRTRMHPDEPIPDGLIDKLTELLTDANPSAKLPRSPKTKQPWDISPPYSLFPIRMEITNFRNFFGEKLTVNFPEGLIAITGDTSAGKTSITDAISYALYGSLPRDNGIGIISIGEKTCEVSLTFRLDNGIEQVEWTITRTKTSDNKNTAELSTTTGQSAFTKIGVVNKAITKLLGCDYSLYSRTVFQPQNTVGKFLLSSLNEQNKTLTELFDYTTITDARKKAKAESTELRNSEANRKGQMATLSDIQPEDIEYHIEQLEHQVGTLSQTAQIWHNNIERINTISEQMNIAERASKIGEQIHKYATEHHHAQQAASETAEMLTAAENAYYESVNLADLISQQIRTTDTPNICPTCGQNIPDQTAVDYQTVAAETVARKNRLAQAQRTHQNAQMAADSAKKALEASITAEGILTDQVANIRMPIEQLHAESEKLKAEQVHLLSVSGETPDITWASTRERLRRMKEDKNKISSQTALRETLASDLSDIEQELNLTDELVSSLAPRRFLAYLLDTHTEQLAHQANQWLAMFGRNERFCMGLAMLSEEDKISTIPVGSLSGGELFLVSTAAGLAVSDVLSDQGARMPVILDEGLASLDSETRKQMIVALRMVADTGRSVIVVSNDPAVRSLVPDGFHVQHNSLGYSSVSTVNTN